MMAFVVLEGIIGSVTDRQEAPWEFGDRKGVTPAHKAVLVCQDGARGPVEVRCYNGFTGKGGQAFKERCEVQAANQKGQPVLRFHFPAKPRQK